MNQATTILRDALTRIADPRNTHFAGDAQVVARAALAAADADQAPTRLDLLSLIRSQMHRSYTAGHEGDEIDPKYITEIEDVVSGIYHGRYIAGYDLRKSEDAARPAPVGAVPAPDVTEAMGPFGAGPMTRVCIDGVPLGDYIKAKAAAPAAPIGETVAITIVEPGQKCPCGQERDWCILNECKDAPAAEHAKPEPAREMTQQERHDDGVAKLMASGDRFAKPEPVDMGNHISVDQARLVDGTARDVSAAWMMWAVDFDGPINAIDAFKAGVKWGRQAGAVGGERYRWLASKATTEDRDGGYSGFYRVPFIDWKCARGQGGKSFYHKTFDDAIDAAIASANQKGE